MVRRWSKSSMLTVSVLAVVATLREFYLVEAFGAGGFGSSSNSKSSVSKKQRRSKKKQRKGLADVADTSTPSSPTPDQPKLDRWGLPVATLDDIFPPLPSHTERIPVDPGKESYSLSEIQECLKNHIDLDLPRFFDQDAKGKILNSDGTSMKLRLLHQSPPVLAIDNFMTETECQEIQSARTPRAHQVDSATFEGSLSTRTSTSWFCHYSDVPVLLSKANRALNIPLDNMEEPQIVRYERGQEFSWHYDEVPQTQLENGGQRLATMLVYLTSVPESNGGGTTFRDLTMPNNRNKISNLVMHPQRGSCLLFFPAFADGTPDDRTLHKSHVLESDDPKWIVQMWIHQNEYSAVLPRGNSKEAALQVMEETSKKLGYE
ncbi:MAG: hypothetical protein SGILL_000209 [Bacillariaceae sp.]